MHQRLVYELNSKQISIGTKFDMHVKNIEKM